MAANFKKQQTLLWKATVTLETKLQIYQLSGDILKTGPVLKIKPQKLPLREWNRKDVYKSEQYQNVARKLTSNYSKTDLAAYIRSSFL